ncbi:histidine kinase/DNA gyrase B/HSP90-like ATPase [Anseongella ginsenosidimutans]|uniref:histidine kinase n=1 Tax=Anseongella ginsenosidimutans TaxID=496056 RepID=A0A4R3KPG8_9SPHI|nr:sensor histidine kinase [Anseongella ginsenosidimutans]QEC53870.1 sensor histidine kinase [Anseongella ginsenosidimutans]TCS86252.1 histidine kinase/DNA gyrase B/HSP90-like ATPase [Anseongella ginsenosidimutans]
MQTSENNLIPVLIVGTLVIVALIIFLFLFVIIYQRRMLKSQTELQQLQTEQQSDLLKAVFEAQESERKRLAEDLHDSVGQVLSVIKFNLHRLEKVCENKTETSDLMRNTRNLAEECILEIRNIIHNMMPHLLTNFGLAEALKELSRKVEQRSGIQVDFGSTLSARYPPEIEITFYRIAQELFSNAIKHSGAREITVTLFKEEARLILCFHDNGTGFDIQKVKHGFGLKNLSSRLQLVDGSLQIDSDSQKGTSVTVIVTPPVWNQ